MVKIISFSLAICFFFAIKPIERAIKTDIARESRPAWEMRDASLASRKEKEIKARFSVFTPFLICSPAAISSPESSTAAGPLGLKTAPPPLLLRFFFAFPPPPPSSFISALFSLDSRHLSVRFGVGKVLFFSFLRQIGLREVFFVFVKIGLREVMEFLKSLVIWKISSSL
ncbi:hypothetical protein L484_015522 [Morus notabilis]|uniref:Uncharacterized protein n=1 Tax=Morus notabilis TaxID=981085 RepID=W9RIV4_9ROSA|nr:hypothetical protein L484_015522 [Morus notabilis]